MDERRGGGGRLAGLLLGVLLVIGGVGLLAAQLYGIDLRFDLAQYGWPLFVILPGLALLLIGLVTDNEPGVGLAVAGSIVTTVGLVLSYQWATDHWSSWAYAWSLIAPTAVGFGMTAWGLLHLNRRVIRGGLGALVAGAIMFLIFFGFFEGLIGIGGDRGLAPLGRTALPIALIVGGVLVILSRFWPSRRGRERGSERERHDAWAGAQPVTAFGPQEAVAMQVPPSDVPPAPDDRAATPAQEGEPIAPDERAWPEADDSPPRDANTDNQDWRSDS